MIWRNTGRRRKSGGLYMLKKRPRIDPITMLACYILMQCTSSELQELQIEFVKTFGHDDRDDDQK